MRISPPSSLYGTGPKRLQFLAEMAAPSDAEGAFGAV
jgi:hypothetical protein